MSPKRKREEEEGTTSPSELLEIFKKKTYGIPLIRTQRMIDDHAKVVASIIPRDIVIKCTDGEYPSNKLIWEHIHFKPGFKEHDYNLPFSKETIRRIFEDFFDLIPPVTEDTDIVEYVEALDYFNLHETLANEVVRRWIKLNQNNPVKLAEAANCKVRYLKEVAINTFLWEVKGEDIVTFIEMLNEETAKEVAIMSLRKPCAS